MSILKQKTLKNVIKLSGVGLHSGKKVNIKLVPQKPNIGIYFKRTDLTLNNIDLPTKPTVLILYTWLLFFNFGSLILLLELATNFT